MNYKKLSNSPDYRSQVLLHSAYWDNMFSESELTKIENYCSTLELKDGFHGKIEDGKTISEPGRKSKVAFVHPNENTSWIFERFNAGIELINENFYNFILNGYAYFQYTEYHAVDNGHYDYHMDTLMGPQFNEIDVRKLSVTFLLNKPNVDFTGGELIINCGNEKESEQHPCDSVQGRILAFPSFMLHKVAPVKTGIRKSIVIWVKGPKFI